MILSHSDRVSTWTLVNLLWLKANIETQKEGEIMQRRCIVFTGLQASGKTTFYRQFFPDLVHVNLDTLHTRNKERILLEECFTSGLSFVVDNTNPTRMDRERYIGGAKDNGYRIIGYYFESSVSSCKERNSLRTGKACVPVSALTATHRIMEVPEWDEGFDELFYVQINEEGFAIHPWSMENGLPRQRQYTKA